MTKPSVVICLFLGSLLTAIGCSGPETQTDPPQGEFAPPFQPAVTGQSREDDEPREVSAPEPAAVEPKADLADTTEAPTPATSVPETEGQLPSEAPRAETASIAEPNVPDTPEATPTAEAPEPEKPEPDQPPPVPVENVADTETQPEEPLAKTSEPDELASFYQAYAQTLQEYVLEDGRVDYGRLRRKRLQLKQLLSEPDELDPNDYAKWSEDEKLAFWINTYNLKMLEIIARNYPIQSSRWLRLTWPPSDIRHIEGIWSDYRFIVMDEEFTLGEVERRFFHRTFADPRAYLAIAYGSRSGPRLRRTPYRGDQLDKQLDEQIRAFLASGQGLRIDRDKQVVHLSALFKPTWRGKDFVGRYAMQKKFKDRPAETRAVLNFLAQYVSEDDVYFLEVENYRIVYMNFDWRIDDSAQAN